MTHEFDGKKYQQASSHQKEWGLRLITELNLQGTERVLDLGCGDGILTAQIADLVPRGEVVGIDASKGMIDVARQKQRHNLRFLLIDINEINFTDEFDVVFSNAALHWIQDHKRLFQNVKSALRKNGTIRFNFAGDGNCSHFFKVIREAMWLPEFSLFFASFQWPWFMPQVREYEIFVRQSGFHDYRVWGENADRFFPNQEAMIGWLDQPSLVPLMAYISQESKARFRNFVVSRMIEETLQEDGRCFETFRRINVFARK